MAETTPGARQRQELQKPANGEPMVVVNQLIKQFGKLRAVDNLTVNIHAGETFGLIGPNGSGKTTLIRMLVGLILPTSGTIRIMNERIPSNKVAAQMGYMTQLSALYLDLTARENMQFFCNVYGLRGKEQKQRIMEMLERVELADRANDVVGKFSSGIGKDKLNVMYLNANQVNEALRAVMLKGADLAEIAWQLTALLIFMLLMIVMSALTMRRQIA